MAGAGYKLFNTGDVLTAAQVNTYLQEQTVMVFASATARTTALSGVLSEGMMSYLQDTNAVEVYDGSAWVSVGSTGDITGVTAGTGISGGGTSGTVTVTNSMATAIDAKGDLIVGTGADTFARLPVGTNDYVLTAASGETTGLKWAAAAGGGKVLQVVQATYSTSTTVSTTSYTDTGLSVSITPSAATSKVLILVAQPFFAGRSAGKAAGALQLVRGSTAIYDPGSPYDVFMIETDSAYGYYQTIASLVYLDSPSTTSATTYKTQARPASTNDSGNVILQRNSAPATITVIEIGA